MNVIKNINNSEIKPVKVNAKNRRIPNQIDLCKKYFYISKSKKAINLKKFNDDKILKLMEDNNSQRSGDVLEQVDYVLTEFEKKKEDLKNKKVDCIRSMILNHKKIPEKWIMKPNYKELLNEAMEDDIVLNYAIECKDIYKKRAGLDQSDEERYLNYKKSLKPEKKFISYINPYSKNYCDSPSKKNLMRDYCLSVQKNRRNDTKLNNNNIFNSYKNNNKLLNKILDKNNNTCDNISKEKIKLPLIYRNNMTEDPEEFAKKIEINKPNIKEKEDLMVTSLYYSGLQNKKDNNKNNDINIKENKLPELPLI